MCTAGCLERRLELCRAIFPKSICVCHLKPRPPWRLDGAATQLCVVDRHAGRIGNNASLTLARLVIVETMPFIVSALQSFDLVGDVKQGCLLQGGTWAVAPRRIGATNSGTLQNMRTRFSRGGCNPAVHPLHRLPVGCCLVAGVPRSRDLLGECGHMNEDRCEMTKKSTRRVD